MSSLREQLIRDEGLRLKAYQDSEGVWTIGYGTNLQVLEIDRALAERWLDDEIAHIRLVLPVRYPWMVELDEARRGVLENMAYNLGIFGLGKFHRMLMALAEKDYETAAKEMLSSKWSEQVGVRAVRLARQMLTGEWQ